MHSISSNGHKEDAEINERNNPPKFDAYEQ